MQASLAEFLRKALPSEQGIALSLTAKQAVVPRLISLLDSPFERVRVEAAWALTNAGASKSEFAALIHHNGGTTRLLETARAASVPELKELVSRPR